MATNGSSVLHTVTLANGKHVQCVLETDDDGNAELTLSLPWGETIGLVTAPDELRAFGEKVAAFGR